MTELERTREFIPNDIRPPLNERAQQIDERIEELRKNREHFDPEKQFVGIRRLGESYTVAEPFAYFDGPTDHELRYNRINTITIFAFGAAISTSLYYFLKKHPYLPSMLRGALYAIPAGYLGDQFYKWQTNAARYKQNTYFAYALMHEKDIPPIQRKKYHDVLQDFTAHRSLNILEWKFRW